MAANKLYKYYIRLQPLKIRFFLFYFVIFCGYCRLAFRRCLQTLRRAVRSMTTIWS